MLVKQKQIRPCLPAQRFWETKGIGGIGGSENTTQFV